MSMRVIIMIITKLHESGKHTIKHGEILKKINDETFQN